MTRTGAVFALLLAGSNALGQGKIFIFTPSKRIPETSQAASLLVDEANRRFGVKWARTEDIGTKDSLVVITKRRHIDDILPTQLRSAWKKATDHLNPSSNPEAFTVASLQHGHVLVIAGQGQRGELFGAGWLLRHMEPNQSSLPRPAAFVSVPDKPVRGYQIGYRMKNNTYDAWTLVQFEQQMRDLAVFGMNTVQVVAPNSDDDRTSPLFHASAEDVVVGLSRLSRKYGLRYDLYYPEMAKDYNDQRQVKAELKQFEDLVKRLPQVDSIHVPGGDPGHTAPEVLFPLLEQQAVILHRYHPNAEVWVSAQGFTQQRFAQFYKLLAQHPAWLTGVFFGPQSRDGQSEERAHIPAQYPVELYPDIGHAMHAQFPIPQWDPLFALTEGREPICPRPEQFAHIYRHFAPQNSGFMLYSEGVNDDVNKFLWASLGWNPQEKISTILREYARYHLAAGKDVSRYANAILALEANWSKPLLASDSTIPQTHKLVQRLDKNALQNWRWHSLVYRDDYDQYLRLKRLRERNAEDAALQELRSSLPTTDRIAAARHALASSHAGPEEQSLHRDLMQLADKLYHEVGIQLSVPLYGASNWERGANLDRIDTPLNDRDWIEAELKKAETLSSESAKDDALYRIANWQIPPVGGFYDDLGDPANEPHLARGVPWSYDPEMYQAAIDGIADRTLKDGWRLSWLSYAETLYEVPLTLNYNHLDTTIGYHLRITYAGEDYTLPMEIIANGNVVQPLRMRHTNPEEFDLDLPRDITSSGSLKLEWKRSAGAGGSGRGGQVAEVWLFPRN